MALSKPYLHTVVQSIFSFYLVIFSHKPDENNHRPRSLSPDSQAADEKHFLFVFKKKLKNTKIAVFLKNSKIRF